MITCFSVVYKPHWASCVYTCCVFLIYWKMRAQEADHISDFFFLLCFISLQVPEDNDEEPEGRASSEEESSDDDKSWVEEVREQRRLLRQEDRDRRRQERKDADRSTVLVEREQNGGEECSNVAESKKTSQPQFYQIKAGEEFRSFNDMARKQKLQKYVFGNVPCVTWLIVWDTLWNPNCFRVCSC